jgi:hypothetical protein
VATTASVTYNTKSLIKQLEATRDRMKKEIAEWEEANRKLPAKQKAWDKKALAWFKKNAAALIDDETQVCTPYHNSTTVQIQVRAYMNELVAAIGESPQGKSDQRPDHDRTHYTQKISPLDEVENAIAMFKGCTDVEIKVSMKSTFFQYLR